MRHDHLHLVEGSLSPLVEDPRVRRAGSPFGMFSTRGVWRRPSALAATRSQFSSGGSRWTAHRDCRASPNARSPLRCPSRTASLLVALSRKSATQSGWHRVTDGRTQPVLRSTETDHVNGRRPRSRVVSDWPRRVRPSSQTQADGTIAFAPERSGRPFHVAIATKRCCPTPDTRFASDHLLLSRASGRLGSSARRNVLAQRLSWSCSACNFAQNPPAARWL